MRGSYLCVAEDGERFEAPVPAFILDADGHGGSPARVLH
jgi:ApaG protein